MAIGSLDRAGRLQQLRSYAKVLVWSGFSAPDEIHSEVFEALFDECRDAAEAERLAHEYLGEARDELAEQSVSWPDYTEYDALEAAFADAESAGIVVLRACEDHWAANDALTSLAAAGRQPFGIAFFTHSDVWHAVEHQMLEVNLWHGDRANVAPGDPLLERMVEILAAHGLAAHFDEGRIEVGVHWHRRPR